MRGSSIVGVTCSIIAIAIAGYSIFKPGPTPPEEIYSALHPSSKLPLAKVVSIQGRWLRQHSQVGEPKALFTGDQLFHLDSVSNDMKGQLELEFLNSGTQATLSSNSRFFLELWDVNKSTSPIFFHLESGQVASAKDVRKGQLFLIQNGQLQTFSITQQEGMALIDPQSPRKALGIVVKPANLLQDNENNSSASQPNIKKITEETIDQYLDQSMQEMSTDFARCQANRIKDVGPLSGQILVGIKVVPEGEVKEIKIIKSEISDVALVSCVKSVLARLKIQSFEGRPVYRSYPIDFE